MKTEISKEEKLKFYKKFHENDFNKKFYKFNDMLCKIGLVSLKVLSATAIIGGIFNPWLFLLICPAIDISLTCFFIRDIRSIIAINKLNTNITYRDYRKMTNSGEWKQLANEFHNKQSLLNNIATNKTITQLNIEKNQNNIKPIKRSTEKAFNNELENSITNQEYFY